MVKFLVEERGAEVNQQDRKRGWTPLHRAARMCVTAAASAAACAYLCHVLTRAGDAVRRAHSRAFPYLEVFEYLLQQGADASILTYEGWNVRPTGARRVCAC
jgi:hypothetical protein